MYTEKLPPNISKYIFRFLSHPVADAIRDRVTEFQTLSNQVGSSDLHTFYIFFFLESKITALLRILDEMYEQLGSIWVLTATTSVRVCGSYTRANFRGTFLSTSLLILIGRPFGRTREFILKYNIIYIESMSRINKLTTSFIKVTNALDKVKNQDEYNIYVSMLDEERSWSVSSTSSDYANTQIGSCRLPPRRIPTRASRKRRGGGTNKVVGDNVVMSDPVTPEETSLPPSPA